MKFYEVQKALEEGKKITSKTWPFEDGDYCIKERDELYIKNKIGMITYYFTKGMPINTLLADDWEIVLGAPEVNAEEVLSEFRSWIQKTILLWCVTPGLAHTILRECLDKLDELSSSKQIKVKHPEKCDLKLIDGNHAVVKTESGKYVIVHLFNEV